MSELDSYKTLGLDEASSFEEVQVARQRLVESCLDDPQRKEQIEAAYDAILMARLRMRQEGKIKVPDRIRFAEKQAETATAKSGSGANSGASGASTWLQGGAQGWLANWLDQPDRSEILWPSVTFAALSGLSALTAASNSAGPSVPLGFGVAMCIYFLNRKEHKFWRAVMLAVIGLLVGIVLGFGLSALLQQQGTVLADNYVTAGVAILTFLLFWLISCFMR
jgi:Protein CHAPERONE-LIKE PROTEIN OF POR1-like